MHKIIAQWQVTQPTALSFLELRDENGPPFWVLGEVSPKLITAPIPYEVQIKLLSLFFKSY